MGFHKTSSSSIQFTFQKNLDFLKKQNFIYPIFKSTKGHCINNHSIPFYSLFSENPEKYHVNIKWKIEDIKKLNDFYKQQIIDIKNKGKNIIFSGEDISSLSELEMKNLNNFLIEHFENYEIIPIVYVRSPYSFLCSNIQEIIKQGVYVDLNSTFYSQKNKIITIKKVFKNIKFYCFSECCKFNNGPVNFFLEIIGLKNIKIYNSNIGFKNKSIRDKNKKNKLEPIFINDKLNPNYDKTIKKFENDEKFFLTSNELTNIKDKLDNENLFFKENLGEEYCDKKYDTCKI